MPSGGTEPNVEFLNKLKELLGIEATADFAGRCGKQVTNMTRYLSGKQKPGDKVLQDCIQNVFGWEVKTECEIKKIPEKLPTKGGVYVLYDSAGNVLYIGQAKNFSAEIQQDSQQDFACCNTF